MRVTDRERLRASGAELGWPARARWWAAALLGLLAWPLVGAFSSFFELKQRGKIQYRGIYNILK